MTAPNGGGQWTYCSTGFPVLTATGAGRLVSAGHCTDGFSTTRAWKDGTQSDSLSTGVGSQRTGSNGLDSYSIAYRFYPFIMGGYFYMSKLHTTCDSEKLKEGCSVNQFGRDFKQEASHSASALFLIACTVPLMTLVGYVVQGPLDGLGARETADWPALRWISLGVLVLVLALVFAEFGRPTWKLRAVAIVMLHANAALVINHQAAFRLAVFVLVAFIGVLALADAGLHLGVRDRLVRRFINLS